MSLEVMMTPIHTSPSPSPSPQPVPAAASSPIIKTTPNTPKVPAPNSPVQGLVERPYAPILPPATHSHERETVEALVGLASTGQLSPTTADLTSSFSAINVATLHNGPPNSYMRTSSEHNHSRNMSSRAIHSNEYTPDTAQPVGRSQDIRSTNGSSSKARRRRRSNSLGVESPRGHSKPYDGHILEEDTVVGDAAQPPRASSPQNYPQASQQDAHHGPRRLLPTTLVPSPRESKSKQQSHPQRQHLPPPPQSQSPRSQQALACPAQQPTVHYSKRTNKPQIPSTRPPRTYSADVHGFKLLRGAIPFQFAQAAADILDQGMEEVETTTTYKVFGLSLQAYRVRDEFMQNVGYRGLHDFYPSSFESLDVPMATVVSEYLPAADPGHARYSTMQTANPKVLYVTVALTALEFRNGLFTLLGGSHANKDPRCTPMNQWDRVQNVLHPGDVLIWRGDLKYLLSPHGGGRCMTMVFKWKPVLDLTK